jgi:hypothetical protein
MSFLELSVVVAIIGLLTATAITTFGRSTLSNGSAEGFARKFCLAMVHARRATISTGDNHYLQLTPSAASATSFALFRRTGGGEVQVDTSRLVPEGVTLTSSHALIEFDFDGAALSGYSIDIVGDDRSWNLAVVTLTGTVSVTETTP